MNNTNKQYIICPVCKGAGKTGLGVGCNNCGGLGVGVFSRNHFFFWRPKIGRAVIELDHLRKKFKVITVFLAFLIGFIGVVSLGYWFFQLGNMYSDYSSYAFWRDRDPFVMVFWLSTFADLFIIYRFSEDARNRAKINFFEYEKIRTEGAMPNNWDELKKSPRELKVDVAGGYNFKSFEAIEQAFLLVDKLNQAKVEPMHLFFATLSDIEVAAVFSRLNLNIGELVNKIKKQIAKINSEKAGKIDLSNESKEVLIEAYLESYGLEQKDVTPKNLLVACIEKDQIIKEVLNDLEISTDMIYNVVSWFETNDKMVESFKVYQKAARYKPGTNMDRAYTSVATPALNQLSYDLTAAAKFGRLEFCVARNKEIEDLLNTFQSGSNGVILVGPTGVGKNTIVSGIAQRMVREDVPRFFQDKRLVEIDASRLVSGSDASQIEGKLLLIIDEVVRAGNIILYINNVNSLVGITSGSEGSLDLSEVLSNALDRSRIYCLASSSSENYRKYIEGKSLGNVMSKIDVNEPVGNQAIQIVESKVGAIEGKYSVYFSYNSIFKAIELSSKYIHDTYLPEKAIKILEQTAVRVNKTKGAQSVVTRRDVAVVIAEITGIPTTKVTEEEGRTLLNLEDRIHENMIGQEIAVSMVSSSLRRARTELRKGERPIANFLFLGPTGVGKTELAKTISSVYFGDEKYMTRVDMSEYQHPDSIKKMIGDASGKKGYLTEAVRIKPFSLVLLDEIEKAHPDIMNLFLQVMDDGRLTDGQGRTIDFTNSIVIATSNVGAIYIQDEIFKGTDVEEIKTVLINEKLNKVLRPELINRFDGVIVFEPLSIENVVDIARIMLKEIEEMLTDKGINFRVEEEGLRILAKEGYDPKFGARPLRRLLQDRVENEIANNILSGNLRRRDTVHIDENAVVNVEKGVEL